MSLYNSRRLSSSQNDWVSLSSPWIQPSHNHNLFHPYNIYPQQIETHCPTLHHPRSHLIYVIFSADSSTPLSCPDIFRVIGSSLMTYLRARWMLIHFYISTDIQLKHSHTINHISLSCLWILPHTPPFTISPLQMDTLCPTQNHPPFQKSLAQTPQRHSHFQMSPIHIAPSTTLWSSSIPFIVHPIDLNHLHHSFLSL